MSTPTGHPKPARPAASGTRGRAVSGPPAPGQDAPGSEPPGPDGLAFYAPPAPLPPAAAGQVIWARPLTGAAALPGAAENILILYHSRTLAGQDTAVSGAISIPPGQPPDGGWPVLSWAHGTTGVADICAPSRDAPGHPSHICNQLVDAMLNQWVERGWAVVKTDYEGLGTPGCHPYLVGASEARGAVDIVVAARQIRPGIGRRWAVMGHSQGGHAALFTASLAPAWDCGLDLIGAVAIAPAGGAHDMITELRSPRGRRRGWASPSWRYSAQPPPTPMCASTSYSPGRPTACSPLPRPAASMTFPRLARIRRWRPRACSGPARTSGRCWESWRPTTRQRCVSAYRR